MRATWAIGLATLLAGCSAACSASPQPAPSASPQQSAASQLEKSAQPDKSGFTPIVCAASIDAAPPTGWRVVGGDVALPEADVVQTSESGRPAPLRLFAKWGLLVRGGATVRITVAPGFQDRAWIGWGQPGEPSTAVQVNGCPATDDAGKWSAFAGGSWVTDPACVLLIVEAGGETARLDTAIGKPCRK